MVRLRVLMVVLDEGGRAGALRAPEPRQVVVLEHGRVGQSGVPENCFFLGAVLGPETGFGDASSWRTERKHKIFHCI